MNAHSLRFSLKPNLRFMIHAHGQALGQLPGRALLCGAHRWRTLTTLSSGAEL